MDGEFNSTDFNEVFQSGEYEDGIPVNSIWAEGDWNGDGDFDSGDFITAFQDGGYETGSSAATMTAPEPSCGILMTIGACCFHRLRKR